MKYITIFEGYDPNNRFSAVDPTPSRTIQDAVVDIPTLLKEFGGDLKNLFDKFNNGLVFESMTGKGVFIDQLNKDEVKRYNEFVDAKAKRDAESAREAELFEQFKQFIAEKVSTPSASSPTSEATE